MAQLQFAKVEPVRFGDFEATPSVSTELRVRLKALKLDADATEAELAAAKDLLSQAFGAKAMQVKEFMDANMFVADLVELAIYLLQGPQAAKSLADVQTTVLVKAANERMAKGMAEKEIA